MVKEKRLAACYLCEERDPPVHPLFIIFEEFKEGCEVFVETGTHYGDAVQIALDLGFKKLHSVEMAHPLAEHSKDRFKEADNVFIVEGRSEQFLVDLIPTLKKRCLFWLDAHGEGGGNPAIEEINIIAGSKIKNHVIIIDDIPTSYTDNQEALMSAILKINSEYKFTWAQTLKDGPEDYVLIAYHEKSKQEI